MPQYRRRVAPIFEARRLDNGAFPWQVIEDGDRAVVGYYSDEEFAATYEAVSEAPACLEGCHKFDDEGICEDCGIPAEKAKAPHLFTAGDFTSHSGKTLPFKIECDALTDTDWECLAAEIAKRVKFYSVSGVPKGGIKLASALQKYRTEEPGLPHLIVDDVLTTGSSILSEMTPQCIGFVIFARGPLPNGVRALWQWEPTDWRELCERAMAVFKRFGGHHLSCSVWQTHSSKKFCNCGFDEAERKLLAEVEAACAKEKR